MCELYKIKKLIKITLVIKDPLMPLSPGVKIVPIAIALNGVISIRLKKKERKVQKAQKSNKMRKNERKRAF